MEIMMFFFMLIGMGTVFFLLLEFGSWVITEILKGRKEMEKTKCCGTCKYHRKDETFAEFIRCQEDWICCNDKSEYYADWTEYEDVCDDWED